MLVIDPAICAAEVANLSMTDRQSGLSEFAEIRLRSNSYLALRNIRCEAQGRVLVLSGCLPSYYLKQIAQAAVAQIEGVERIDNRIEVLVAK